MEERKTKDITTPGGHAVTVKEYLTAREVNDVLRHIFGSQEVSTDADGAAKTKLSMSVGIERNIRLVEAAVVSLDGSAESLSDRLQDLPASEYAAILNEVKGLAEGHF
jgi:hypothetical protein